MLKVVDDRMSAFETIAGGGGVRWVSGAREDDTRLASLWHHDSVKAALPRQYRAELIREASSRIVGADT